MLLENLENNGQEEIGLVIPPLQSEGENRHITNILEINQPKSITAKSHERRVVSNHRQLDNLFILMQMKHQNSAIVRETVGDRSMSLV